MTGFDVNSFLFSVNPGTIALAILLGLFMGVAMGRAIPGYFTPTYLFWQYAAGLVFFIPLAILRGAQGSDTWVRLFGTGLLWGVFVTAKFVGALLIERRDR